MKKKLVYAGVVMIAIVMFTKDQLFAPDKNTNVNEITNSTGGESVG